MTLATASVPRREVRRAITKLVKVHGTRALARKLNVSEQAIYHWTGPRQSLPAPNRARRLLRMARALETN